MRMTSSTKIMLIACGSFSPPTPMHFRMFEIARDHIQQMGLGQVVGGIVSPVHDSYAKKGLVSATHRCAMIKIGLKSSDWIHLSDWETQQEEWTRTRQVLQYHQNYINSYLKDTNGTINNAHIPAWIPEGIKRTGGQVQLKLLCGADLLESFATPGLWKDEDLEAILGYHGIVVISRAGSNPEQFIFNSDLLSRYRRNITIVTNWVTNDVSSTLIRRLLGRGLSVKYLLDDHVAEYIRKFGLFGSKNETSKYILTPGSAAEAMSISPISPINDPDLYIEHQNQRNKLGSSCEAMDETDFPMPPIPTTLNKVFCCAGESPTATKPTGTRGTFLGRPGSAVQIITTAAPSPVTSPDGTTGTKSIVQHITLDESDASAGKKVGASPRRCSGGGGGHTESTNSTNNDNTTTTTTPTSSSSSTKRTTTTTTATTNNSTDNIATDRSSSTKRDAIAMTKATLSTSTAQTSGREEDENFRLSRLN
ncbi:nicotinamide/nicotinic acid mononucleotide adenylyltransferase 1 isoform X1 [Anopheles stephensi]|uniref:nicotinamide/nicotinic acid mononucleotide adenylyltransferase 1 isoform X1 n=2 Tax=Anopheles stephensi TaxID=30069 RepID=UPI001658C1AA|nr:nicotinamide/nicotinic acid mononucleotide adenylyltransferase 1 isoform X1 [Anopheles stephensi]